MSLNSVKNLIFAMVKCCDFFAVPTKYLNIPYKSFGFRELTFIAFNL
jgi:hypothetical protein